MADTTHLILPLLAAAQAQKHVTHNDALLRLDAIVQLSVIDRDLTDPPADPSDGDRYIPAAGATGAWADWDLNIAWFVDGVWTKLVPREGWRVWVDDEDLLLVWDGGAWVVMFTSTPPDLKVFTSDGTWNKPAGLTAIIVEVQGGGGGGYGPDASQLGAGGAGGGYARRRIAAASLGSSETVTVGAGGSGGAAGGNSGSDGGASSFGALVSADGGGSGGFSAGGDGGSGSSGDINSRGSDGQRGITNRGGNGGGSYFGGGARGTAGAGRSGDTGGGGAGGNDNTAGGDGGDGLIIVTEFY